MNAAKNAFAVPDDLDAVLADVWTRLGRGVVDRRSAFHTPTVATADVGGPRQRVMVLRGVDRATATLRFHTDARSGKVASIAEGARASVLGYDAGARIQLSLAGHARIAGDADAAWRATAPGSRRAYLAEPGPGTPVEAAVSGLAEALLERAPTPAESEPGVANFRVVLITLDRIEWLELNSRGNRRAAFASGADADQDWSGTWLIP